MEEDGRSAKDASHLLRRMAWRWKVLVGVGAGLIVLALAIDWPPPTESSLPETTSFLVFLGAVVGAAGIIMGFSRE
ncbi:hypothetical protein [Nitrospira moscoviensis]|uniref:Uncharacterized protein n=1 Tax=Nitrospira moscoviensis TaxID=42253 RepID=A0A0K2GCG3_NITMO|nr:hypothetical protein [Nitrospira moscoviensis]ALA58638.1 hypothetical protein NITMOv2_2222 [Nitrospira moscoviensis]